jgi:hypothetical protein
MRKMYAGRQVIALNKIDRNEVDASLECGDLSPLW